MAEQGTAEQVTGEQGTAEQEHEPVGLPGPLPSRLQAGTNLETLMADGIATLEWPPLATDQGHARVEVGSIEERRRQASPAVQRRGIWRDILVGVVVVACLHLFVLQVSVVRGMSMSPSLSDGDRLVVDRVAYSLGDVARFDVVIMGYPANPSIDFVKRVIGLPGDRVTLRDGRILVNGEVLDEDFPHREDRDVAADCVVPAQHVFVLGDNRPISCDSRSFGMVPIDYLKGKVRCRFWPIGRLSLF